MPQGSDEVKGAFAVELFLANCRENHSEDGSCQYESQRQSGENAHPTAPHGQERSKKNSEENKNNWACNDRDHSSHDERRGLILESFE
jgi:hypothetical protein